MSAFSNAQRRNDSVSSCRDHLRHRLILQRTCVLISDRGSIVVDSLTLMDAVAYLKARLPPVLPPRVEEYMRL
jgi:hypothetical protein